MFLFYRISAGFMH